MRAVTIKYRDGKRAVSVKADSCSGEIPAHSDTYYCIFYLNKAQVARVPKSHLLPGYYEVYERLFGRPWLDKIRNAPKIVLSEWRNFDEQIGGFPRDAENIWRVNYDAHTWVIQCPDRAILHIMNNKEVTRKGKFTDAVKKLFPGKKVYLMQPSVMAVEL